MSRVSASAILLVLVSCGAERDVDSGAVPPQPSAAAEAGADDHGRPTELGAVTVAGARFDVVQLGDLEPGHEVAFEIASPDLPENRMALLNAYLWIESEDGTQLSAPEKGLPSGDRLHFHASIPRPEPTPHHLVLRIRGDDSDERGTIVLPSR